MTDSDTGGSCRACGEEIEDGLVCSDCEGRVDDLIQGFAALNQRKRDTDSDTR